MITYRFYRHYVDMVEGSVNAAVMLSFAVGRQAGFLVNGDRGEFWKFTQDDWFKNTGLSRSEVETCRAILRRTGFWHEKLSGIPASMHYRVDFKAFNSAEKEIK